jgi:hypothetical protein
METWRAFRPGCSGGRCLINPFALCQDNHPRNTVKKVSDFTFPRRDATYQTLPGRENFKLFPARESLVSDIPAGEIVNFFTVQEPKGDM